MVTLILERLRKARVENKLSQENMANYLSITQSAYAKLERGETHLTVKNLLRICNYLSLNPIDLFINNKDKSKNTDQLEETINKMIEIQNKDLLEIRNLLLDLKKTPKNNETYLY